ncbi:MAG: HD domain-containing protein [Rhodospirillales bacterium]|nr:HD domain-containing protein [Rhodospirillales bacterium]MCB9996343.1 HD domain-containing protein [Rhodospirillales bacterium]
MLREAFKTTADDYAFILEINDRFPHILPAFEALLAVAPQDRPDYAREWVPEHYDLGLVLAMLEIHDIAEAITGDFTIHDNISKPEKYRLEEIAARLIFEAYPQQLALWRDFENKNNPEALIGHDIEKAQVYFRCLDYERDHPYLGFKFDDFWNNKPQWNTDLGDTLHQYTAGLRTRLHGPPQILPVHPKNQ